MTRGNQGQALVEFSVIALFLIPLLFSMGYLLYRQWTQASCAHQTFEATHAALVGGNRRRGVAIRELPDRVEGTGRCHDLVERVVLPRLEFAPW